MDITIYIHNKLNTAYYESSNDMKGELMRLDRDKLVGMVSLPDDELWRAVVEIGKTHGFILPEKTPPHEELEKLRSIARDGAKMSISSALRILNNYRK